jgi:hypothetical protein
VPSLPSFTSVASIVHDRARVPISAVWSPTSAWRDFDDFHAAQSFAGDEAKQPQDFRGKNPPGSGQPVPGTNPASANPRRS